MDAIYANAQWAVTEYGLQSIERGIAAYDIPARRLLDRHGRFYEWPLEMADKPWVDLDTFCEAFALALTWHDLGHFTDISIQRGHRGAPHPPRRRSS